jgi:AraC-like DNA-binding protein
MRRLQRARRLLLQGVSLAEAAFACGFADQSHLTRQFRRAYGVTPGRWRALQKGSQL